MSGGTGMPRADGPRACLHVCSCSCVDVQYQSINSLLFSCVHKTIIMD